MAKKKKRTGGGGQQQKPPADPEAPAPGEEGDEKEDAASGEAPPADKEADGKDKGKEDKGKGKEEKAKKAPPPVVTAVLKVDMHCDGCAKRIRASVRHYPGVEGVGMEVEKGTMTVVGRFDAKKLRDRVATKTKKKVDLLPNNSSNAAGNKNSNKERGDGKPGKEHVQHYGQEDKGKIDDHHEEDKGSKDDKPGGGGGGGKGKGGKDSKKPVVPVVGTVVLKIGSFGLHCDGCMNRIRSKLFKIKGVEQVGMDMAKNQVTVTGTMDAKALPEKLRKKVRRPVDVVPAKDKEDGKDKEKEGGKEKEKEAATKALTAEMEAWKAAFYDQHALIHTQFMLSDENPNACSLM
ncbi:hypothetical protein ACP4OV_000059 [Aristida adscensionis]